MEHAEPKDAVCCRVAVSLQMVEEYDSFCKDFRKAVHENQDQGNLDLGTGTSTCLTAKVHLAI